MSVMLCAPRELMHGSNARKLNECFCIHRM